MLMRFFTHPVLLWTAAVLPALAVLALWARRRRRVLVARLGPPGVIAGQVELPAGRWRAVTAWILGILLVVIGAAGPHWGVGPSSAIVPGRDIVIVVDLSRSMMAQDALPSRLGKAKDALREFADAVQSRGGHRLALVGFAGRAAVVCPLTHDYDHFRAKVAALSADPPPAAVTASGPSAVSGTRIGAGLQRAVELLDPQYRSAEEIVLVSDGDDPAGDEEWRAGIAAAREAGIPVDAVGIGDPNAGWPIQLDKNRLAFHGAEVRTQLHEQPLREIAAKTGGVYVAARTGPPGLRELFRTRLSDGPTREALAGTLPQPISHSPVFFAAALTFIAGAMFPVRPQLALHGLKRAWGIVSSRVRRAATAVVALMLVSGMPPTDWLRRGNDALTYGRPDDAIADYARAAEGTTDPGLAAFNKGVALYRLGRYREAELEFRRCLSDATGGRRVRSHYNLGCSFLQESQGRLAGPLHAAVSSFESGLKEMREGDPLSDDARNNLELSKQLLAAIRQTNPNEAAEPPDRPPDQPPATPVGREEGGEPTRGRERAAAQAGPDGRPLPKNDGRTPTDKQSSPGKGNLPPLPDEDTLAPMTPEDAAAHLEKAVERIAAERQAALKRTAPGPATTFPDW
jgi:Ca-activated chloride channel family protein